MDVKLSPTPTLNDADQSTLYTYIRDVSTYYQFTTAVLQVLVEERRNAHRKRLNSQRATKSFQVEDLVKAHVQVHSNATEGIVSKLSYQGRGPYQIKEVLNANSYSVQRYNQEDAPTRKYKDTELYLLPPGIFSHNPVDTLDQRNIDFFNAPVVSPFKKLLQIELYNDKYFPTNSKYMSKSSHDQPSCTLDKSSFVAHKSPTSIPTIASLCAKSQVTLPVSKTIVPFIPDLSLVLTQSSMIHYSLSNLTLLVL